MTRTEKLLPMESGMSLEAFDMICPECKKRLTNEEDCYGHDCEAVIVKARTIQDDT